MEPLSQLRRQSAMEELQSAGWLKHVEWLAEIDSTNNRAKQFVQPAERGQVPALFVTDRQTAGRGRSGNAWWSPDGCLMLTLVIDASELPTDPVRYPQLALVTGLALGDTVDHFLGRGSAQLKWPNDVYVAGRKLAGILIESLQTRGQPTMLAVGIGINVDVDWRHAPRDIQKQAICLSTVARQPIERESVLIELVHRFQAHLQQWREDSAYWQEAWQQRSLLHDRIVTAQVGEQAVVGKCEGIDDQGRLLLRADTGLQTISAAQIVAWN
jgi:BirA family transcriptional regulator, biotin operon repressor / biotin---[acetyl-CoA-carboxylase] ligase